MKKTIRTEEGLMLKRIDEYTCDYRGCKTTFVDENGQLVGDKIMPPDWGHAQLLASTQLPNKKKRYRKNLNVHLCPEHAAMLLDVIRHDEEVE